MDTKGSVGDLIEDGVLIVDRYMKVLYANRTLLRWCGLTDIDDMTGVPCHLVFQHSFLPCNDRCPFQEIFSSGKPSTVESLFSMPDGKEMHYELNATPVLNERGEITQIIEVYRDITAQKLVTQRASEPVDFISSLMNSFSNGIAVIDRGMRVVMANKHYALQGGLTAAEMSGMHCYSACLGYAKPCISSDEGCPAQDTFRTGLPAEVVRLHHDEQGRERFLELKTFPVKHASDTVEQVVETIKDITARVEHRMKERLRILEMKEEMDALRDELSRVRGSKDALSLSLNQHLSP